LGWLQAERGLAASSANRHLHALRTFWQYLVREGIATTNPGMDAFMLPTQKKLPAYLTIPEQEHVLTVLSEDHSSLGRRAFTLVATGLFTGLRCAELAALQVQHVNLDAGWLRVINGKGGKDRELPIVPRLEAIVREYLEKVRPQLVGRPLGYLAAPSAKDRNTWRLEKYVNGRVVCRNLGTRSREEAERRRAELSPAPPPPPFVFVNAHPTGGQRVRRAGQALLTKTVFQLVRRAVSPIIGRPVHPHMLRHSFATRLYEKGGDLLLIRDAMGHASIN
jgi:site-specific recombinase XerD